MIERGKIHDFSYWVARYSLRKYLSIDSSLPNLKFFWNGVVEYNWCWHWLHTHLYFKCCLLVMEFIQWQTFLSCRADQENWLSTDILMFFVLLWFSLPFWAGCVLLSFHFLGLYRNGLCRSSLPTKKFISHTFFMFVFTYSIATKFTGHLLRCYVFL